MLCSLGRYTHALPLSKEKGFGRRTQGLLPSGEPTRWMSYGVKLLMFEAKPAAWGTLSDIVEPWKRTGDEDIQRTRELVGTSFIDQSAAIDRFLTPTVDQLRPFISERTYVAFWWYRAILGRIVVFLQTDAKSGRFKPWFTDEGILQGLDAALTTEEMRWQFKELESMHFGWVVEILEGKILADLRKVVSGARETSGHRRGAGESARCLESHAQLRGRRGHSP